MTVDAPGMQHALVVNQFVPGPAHVIHNLVLPAFLQRAADAPGQVVEDLVPAHALPLAFTSFTGAAQRIEDAFGIVDLVDGGRSFGAIAAATSRVGRIAFEFLDPRLVLVDVGQQSATRLTVETDRWHQRIVFLDFSRPLRSVVFRPVVPAVGWRIRGESAVRLV